MRSQFLLFAIGLGLSVQASAQSYPNRPVTLVAPFSAGGDADLSARNLSVGARNVMGANVVVVNRVGAGGAIGTTVVRDAKADGYTLLLSRIGSQVILPALNSSTAYKWNEFTFLGLLELNPVACAVKAESPHRRLSDLVAAIKAAPGKLNYSSSGSGTVLNLAPKMLLQSSGLGKDDAVEVPYKGAGEATAAVLAGDVDFICTNLTAIIGNIKGKKLRALAITTPERVAELPDVMTVRESGYPQLEAIVGWSALVGPPKMEKAHVDQWADALKKIARDPQWLAGTAAIGGIPKILGPAETEKFVAEQFATYEQLGRSLNLQLK